MQLEARPAVEPADWERRATVAAIWWGRAVVVVAVLAALATLVVNGDGLSLDQLATSPHLLGLDLLSNDPVRSIWFLHAQVPIHNAVVAAAGWSPLPLVGTLFVLFSAAVLGTGLLLHGLLVRWGTPPLAAGAIAALAMVNPALLDTIRTCGIQVPVALLVVAALWAAQRYLDRPAWPWLLLLSGVLTVGALTWQALHPAWVVGIVLLAAVARPAAFSWPRLLAALAVPAVLVGGWALKNQVVFGEPTLASSAGFDMHQGITGPMSTQGVAAAVADGAVEPLAQMQPWGTLDYYGPNRGGTGICFPAHGHRATLDATKAGVPGDRVVPNYNNECYLPLYQQARHDALTLALRYPARYLTTRDAGLVLAYGTADGCTSDPCTWMDRLYQPLLGKVDGQVTMYDWNLRLNGTEDDHVDVTLSMVLVVASAAVAYRGLVALWRFRSLGWRAREEWPTGELLWVVAGVTVVLVIGAATLIEVGDNARMRSALDPLLFTLPLAAAVRWLRPATPYALETDIPPGEDGAGAAETSDDALAVDPEALVPVPSPAPAADASLSGPVPEPGPPPTRQPSSDGDGAATSPPGGASTPGRPAAGTSPDSEPDPNPVAP